MCLKCYYITDSAEKMRDHFRSMDFHLTLNKRYMGRWLKPLGRLDIPEYDRCWMVFGSSMFTRSELKEAVLGPERT